MSYNPSEGNNNYTGDQLEKWALTQSNDKLTPAEKQHIKVMFCESIARGNTATHALQQINGGSSDYCNAGKNGRISRKTLYYWRKMDDQFKEDWDEAFAVGCDVLEQKASDMAFEGNAQLIKFLLQIKNPNRYAVTNKIAGPQGEAVQVNRIELVPASLEDGAEVASLSMVTNGLEHQQDDEADE